MTKALRGLAIKTPWLKTVTKILLAGALAATCFNVALAGPYEDGVAAMNNMEDEKAFQIFKPLADSGHAKAQNTVGFMYAMGMGIDTSNALATVYYRKAAEQGNVQAQANLARQYREGYGVQKSDATAAYWYKKAAEQGDTESAKILKEITVPKAPLGFSIYKNKPAPSAKAKQDALQVAGRTKADGFYDQPQTAPKKKAPEPFRGVDQSRFVADGMEKSVQKCAAHYRKRKYDKAYKKCLKPALKGNAVAQNNLGFIQDKRASMGRKSGSNSYSYGLEDGEDNSETWFRRAANQGYAAAQYDFSNNGGGFQWKVKSAENGYSLAQMALGEFYENTDQGDPNYKMAVYWYEKSAAQGVPYAQERLQKIYSGGYAKKSDAAEVAERMASNGSVDTFINTIQVNRNWVEPGDKQSEMLYAEGRNIQAAKRGNAKATYIVGTMQATSEDDVNRDQGRLEQARLYTLSAEMGYVIAQYELAKLYHLGDKINKSYPQATYWYKKAAAQGHEDARANLRYLLQSGRVSIDEIPQSAGIVQRKLSPKENFFAGLEAGYKKDFEKAETRLLRSARKNYVPAQAALGKMYYNGESVTRSIESSYKWYGKAANNGDVQSQYMMGYLWDSNATKDIAYKMVITGLNVDRVLKARSWYQLAAQNGHQEAKKRLNALSSYKPAPVTPIKRGWFEQMAIDAYDRSTQPRVYNTPISPPTVTCGAWRCYSVGGGKEQCFRDCG